MDYQEKSFWLATSGAYTPNPPLQSQVNVDVAIIGGGFTGMATAYSLKKQQPSLNVAVLESQVVGFGASGRNAAFGMTVFGLSLTVTHMLHGPEKTRAAFRYMERAVDYLGDLVLQNGIDCDYERPGFLRMATTPGYVKRIREEIELAHRLGFTDITWLDKAEAQQQVNSPRYLGAWWEPRMALINPVKMVRGMKNVAERLGAQIFENTPVTEIRRDDKFYLQTPQGTCVADKIVFATNAYSHLIPQIHSKQMPAFTYIVLTEPLSDAQVDSIGWANRQGVEDARNLIHYYRLTADNRLLMGGGPVGLTYGDDMAKDKDPHAFRHLQRFIPYTFPSLQDVAIEYSWGGPISITVDMTPSIGFLGDPRAIFSLGCIGHGVSLTHMNGQLIADLVLERKTELTELWFVNRKMIPWPPEPLRIMAGVAIRGYLELEDWWYERNEPSMP